ncbi:MAG: DUF5723 family protein [Bacteroidota bacterium]
MKNRKTIFFPMIASLAILTVMVCNHSLASGDRANIAGVSMARTFVASSRGLEAVGTNPANLVLPHRGSGVQYTRTTLSTPDSSSDSSKPHATKEKYVGHWETPPALTFTLVPPFGISMESDFINYDIYNQYFTGTDYGTGTRTGTVLSDDDKNKIMSIFPSGLAETHSDIDLRLLGLTIHNDFLGDMAFTITDRISINLDVPRDYLRFAFFGLDSAGSNYDVSGTSVRAWYIRDYAFSYARRIPQVRFIDDFAAGITLKVVHGYGVAITDKFNGTFGNQMLPDGSYRIYGNFDSRILRANTPDVNTDSTKFSAFPSPAGKGFGIDFGMNGELRKGLRVAFSITDIGSINWTENTKQTVANTSFSSTNPGNPQDNQQITNGFKGSDTTTGAFSTALPTVMRMGAAFQADAMPFLKFLPGEMLIVAQYEQGFNSSPGNTTRARFSLGTELRPLSWIPLRTGISLGGADRFNWAAGFGFDFNAFNLNIGTENIDLLFSPKSYNQFSAGVQMIWRI